MPKRVDYLKMYVGYQNNNQLVFQKHDRHWVIEIESPTEFFVRGEGNLGHMTVLFSNRHYLTRVETRQASQLMYQNQTV